MADQMEDLKNTLTYIYSELNRIQTIAGTLSTIENRHYRDLLNMGDDRLNQMANEEQNAARQLGQVKQMCLTMAQKVDELQKNDGQTLQ
ncbi:hypothetical protein L1765_07235 [Microaerobacter geothermalis]|uniref:hypothetical protein n=1 Tax=Microaerobacter geothermalis TaxID=674972 RepID=UPI001F3CCAA2|nr:hypothetical protein [Microaerobacter geothermalis]MCF6093772.1 hypothetical protein [Microaerobacter geothermalis]